MCRVTEHKKFLIKLKSCFWILFSAQKSIEKWKMLFQPFFITKKGWAKKASPWKFDYPLTNAAKISKLATLKQLKFLRLLIVVGPSLHFLRDRIDFEVAIAYKTKWDTQFYTELAVHIAELCSLSQCNGGQRKKHEAKYVSAVLCAE